MQQRQQQYEHEKQEKEEEVVPSAADTVPVRYRHQKKCVSYYALFTFCEQIQDNGSSHVDAVSSS